MLNVRCSPYKSFMSPFISRNRGEVAQIAASSGLLAFHAARS
jgi:hypothetical protein